MARRAKPKRNEVRPGDWLNRVVEVLERALCHNQNFTVEAKKRLRSEVSDTLREFDVVVTIRDCHPLRLVGIECRDRSRPVDEPQVEAFWAKCTHTGVDHGIIVSPFGFTDGAKKLAHHYRIGCYTLDELESLPWLPAPGLHFVSGNFDHIDVRFIVLNAPDERLTDAQIRDPYGTPADLRFIEQEIGLWMKETGLHDDARGPREICLKLPTPGFSAYAPDKDASYPVPFCLVQFTQFFCNSFVPFQRLRYADDGIATSRVISDVAVACGDVRALNGALVFANSGQGRGDIVYVHGVSPSGMPSDWYIEIIRSVPPKRTN